MCRGRGCCREATQPPQAPLVLTRGYASITDGTPPAIAATESRPCINHGQPQAFKRRDSAEAQLCGGRGCCREATQPPQAPLVLTRGYASITDGTPPAIAATESRPCINHGQPQAFKRRDSAEAQLCGGRGCCREATQNPQDPPSSGCLPSLVSDRFTFRSASHTSYS